MTENRPFPDTAERAIAVNREIRNAYCAAGSEGTQDEGGTSRVKDGPGSVGR